MKTTRYRIRVITLVLLCSLLAAMLWIAKSVWFPAVDILPSPGSAGLFSGDAAPSSALPGEALSASPAPQPLDPWADPALSSSGESALPPGDTALPSETSPSAVLPSPSPEALFDTFGL